MKLENLHQPPFNTTLMGVVKAVLDYHGFDVSDAVVYGGSGHAFLVNLHDQLCPSSPYVWKGDGMAPLLGNLGLRMTDLGFFHAGSTAEERAGVERQVKEHLDRGRPCSLCNMDNQVIYGYDEGGFLTARPWPGNPDYPPGTLTFGEWTEFGSEIHANFFAFEKTEQADRRGTLRDSLRYALDLGHHPEKYEFERYAIGPRAYDHWAAAAEEHGASHGNWWNGTVWSECRARAADYFEEMAGDLEGAAVGLARETSVRYREISERLERIADREMDPDRKIEAARDLKQREVAALGRIEELIALLV